MTLGLRVEVLLGEFANVLVGRLLTQRSSVSCLPQVAEIPLNLCNGYFQGLVVPSTIEHAKPLQRKHKHRDGK